MKNLKITQLVKNFSNLLKNLIQIFTLCFCLLIILPESGYARTNSYTKNVISKESQLVLEDLQKKNLNQLNLRKIVDDGELKQIQQLYEDYLTADNEKLVKEYQVTIRNYQIDNTDVIDIRPLKEDHPEKIIVYVHGGAFVFLSAKSSYKTSLPIARDLNIRVIAVDYKLAPEQKYTFMVQEIEKVIHRLIEDGYISSNIALMGDSAGGALVVSTAYSLMNSSKQIRLGTLVLLSPWIDLACQENSIIDNQDTDPILRKKDYLEVAADLVVDQGYDINNFPLNPVHLKYERQFPPVLIQLGTRDILREQIELFYDKLRQKDITSKIDRYEGMWHVFQGSNPELPESVIARKSIKQFINKHLKNAI